MFVQSAKVSEKNVSKPAASSVYKIGSSISSLIRTLRRQRMDCLYSIFPSYNVLVFQLSGAGWFLFSIFPSYDFLVLIFGCSLFIFIFNHLRLKLLCILFFLCMLCNQTRNWIHQGAMFNLWLNILRFSVSPTAHQSNGESARIWQSPLDTPCEDAWTLEMGLVLLMGTHIVEMNISNLSLSVQLGRPPDCRWAKSVIGR